MPRSKLAETAKQRTALLREFEAADVNEKRHRRLQLEDKLANLPLTRERFEK